MHQDAHNKISNNLTQFQQSNSNVFLSQKEKTDIFEHFYKFFVTSMLEKRKTDTESQFKSNRFMLTDINCGIILSSSQHFPPFVFL